MNHHAIWILTCIVMLTGCTDNRYSQKDAIIKSISFRADKRTIKEVFEKLPTISSAEGKDLLLDTFGRGNLSAFLLTHPYNATNQFSFFVDMKSTVAISRCAVAGKSLVTYADLSGIEFTKGNGEWKGVFSFNVENSYTGMCHFVMIEAEDGFMVTRLYIPQQGHESPTSSLVVFDIGNIEHLHKNKDRRYFDEIK